MTAQHLFLLEFLRLRDEETTRKLVNELLARQRDDGTWAIYWEGEPNLAATVEAYAALRMAGFDADDPRLAGARRFVEDRGGIGASRVFTRIWLSLFGLWSWDEIPQLPPELVLMRPEMPISVYSFSCWARQTIVPLTVVMHYRPVRRLPPRAALPRAQPRPGAAPDDAREGLRPAARPLRPRAASSPVASWRSTTPSAGSSTGRSSTAPGAGSSRPGSGR